MSTCRYVLKGLCDYTVPPLVGERLEQEETGGVVYYMTWYMYICNIAYVYMSCDSKLSALGPVLGASALY